MEDGKYDKLAHRIKLKKRLNKAYKKLDIDREVKETVDTTADDVKRSNSRSNPYKNALKKQEAVNAQKQEERERKDQEIKERQERISKTIENKKKVCRMLHEKTKKGQSNLNRQVDLLLGKIMKNNNSL